MVYKAGGDAPAGYADDEDEEGLEGEPGGDLGDEDEGEDEEGEAEAAAPPKPKPNKFAILEAENYRLWDDYEDEETDEEAEESGLLHFSLKNTVKNDAYDQVAFGRALKVHK